MQSMAAPTDPQRPTQPDLSLLRRFIPYLWQSNVPGLRLRLVAALALLLGAKGIMLGVPFLYGRAIDALSGPAGAALSLALALIAGYALARFASVIFENVRNVVYERVGQRAIRQLALDVFGHLHALSLRFHLERRTGGLSRAIERGTKSIDTMLYFLIFNIAPTVVELIAVCVIFWLKFSWELVAVTLVFVVAYIGFTAWVTEWRSQLRRTMVDQDSAANTRAIDSLLNYETVKYFNNEAHEIRRYDKALARYEDASVRSENSLAALNIGQSFLTLLLLALAMGWVAYGHSQGRFSVGDVVLINALLTQLFRPLDVLGWVYREIRQGLIDMETMFGLIDTNPEISDAVDAHPLIPAGGRIEFDHVDFSYEPRRKILHDMSFAIPAGHRLAVVGPSGAGKSTLSRILYRFYDYQAGAVRIDGQDVRTLQQKSLRAAIGIVPQDTVLFNDTIRYNIAYGRPGASDEEIFAAARRAQIHDFVVSLPDGYDTMVGERGLKLSGGEKQRVAIARTILKDPPILILDEATSALDTATEREIQSALDDIASTRTTLVIAHRLSTVVNADEIIVLDRGRIVERGRHADLIARGGVYADMWAKQLVENDAPAAE
jgi:ATP-binding cassette, subfamily B, heavy metal transporter